MEDFNVVLASQGAKLSDDGRVLDFGNVPGEYSAMAASGRAALVPLLSLTPLRLTGQDRLDFLHGQVSNEVKRLEPGHSSLALMLNVKGHTLAQMRVYRRDEDLFVAVEGGQGALVLGQLGAHIIFDQVEIQDLSDAITSFTLQGEAAARTVQDMLDEVPQEGRFVQVPFESAKVLVAPAKRSEAGGLDLHVLSRDAGKLFERLVEAGATPAGEEALDIARVTAGIAAAETEGGEGVLPQEAGLERAVSYRKGCYLGQEIMARIEARGKLRRDLRGLALSGWPDGQDIIQDGKKVGRLGKVVRHPELGVIALAVLRNDLEEASVEAGGVPARLSPLPFERAETAKPV